ncbi:hypothetical protein [Roseateles amylovorans]|uniref:Leucine-rich repeat domain-containing protein n=1 Tax=Roseateles amylovorans TaxID=2978473 RepID=A0ABY6AZC8_9BURK|nr:hypothetical protein [Roseateles amylovorans]UXH77940.1 hypothetical protein N4261_23760 [Roseateles amylovorans]
MQRPFTGRWLLSFGFCLLAGAILDAGHTERPRGAHQLTGFVPLAHVQIMFSLDRFNATATHAMFVGESDGPDPFSDPRPLLDNLQRWLQEPQTQDEGREMAAEIIEAAWRKQMKTLGLQCVNVSNLPRLPGFGHLEDIYLNGNTLQHFPDVEAPQLVRVWVSGACNRGLAHCPLPPSWEALRQRGRLQIDGNSYLLRSARPAHSRTSVESHVRRVNTIVRNGRPLEWCVEQSIPLHPALIGQVVAARRRPEPAATSGQGGAQ